MTDQIIQTFASGIAVGATYSLIALGFVFVFAATHILNFAQGAFVALGAYLTYQIGSQWGLPFAVAVIAAAAVCAILSLAFERAVVRHIPASNQFASIMATVGALFAIEATVSAIWGAYPLSLGDPWGVETVELWGVYIAKATMWTIGVSTLILALLYYIMQHTRAGLSMRAVVSNPLAARACGVNLSAVRLMVWGLAGTVGALGGIFLSAGPSGISPDLGTAAFAALPAIVLGGLDSPEGAIVGGLIVGLAQQYAVLLQPTYFPFLGNGFPAVVPYVILVAVLLVRPNGIFGSKAVFRF